MLDKISFSKYSGCGNDFIIIDNRSFFLSLTKQNVLQLCHRNYGVGADGVILLEKGSKSPYRMRIFNSDGSEAEMCGNGLRCLANFIFEKELCNSCSIETLHGMMQAAIHPSIKENKVIVFTEHKPQEIVYHEFSIESSDIKGYYLDTGVPHFTIFVNDLDSPNHFKIAPLIRNHACFLPRGTNVNFAKVTSQNSLSIRTYERGVENETLACGTGAIATALTAASQHHFKSPIEVQTKSKDLLEISFEGSFPNISKLSMKGPANKIFEGTLHLKSMEKYGK